MRKSIKAIICAASAVVMCAAPTIPALSGTLAPLAITAEAADEVTFDATALNSDCTEFESMGIKYKKSNGNVLEVDVCGTTPALQYVMGLPEFRNKVVLPANIKCNGIVYKVTVIKSGAFGFNEANNRDPNLHSYYNTNQVLFQYLNSVILLLLYPENFRISVF